MTTSSSDKQAALQVINQLPDDATLDDIIYELYFRAHVDAGLRDIDQGRTVSHDEVKQKVARWLRRAGP